MQIVKYERLSKTNTSVRPQHFLVINDQVIDLLSYQYIVLKGASKLVNHYASMYVCKHASIQVN